MNRFLLFRTITNLELFSIDFCTKSIHLIFSFTTHFKYEMCFVDWVLIYNKYYCKMEEVESLEILTLG